MTYRDAAAWIVCRLADGLAYAHEHGIIHRDLKPANILLTDDGEPLILDFNLAADSAASDSASALVGGTLPYMAPEHIRALQSGGRVSESCDVYSLGVILFEMLTGATPYPVRQGSFEQVAEQMLVDRQLPAPLVGGRNSLVSPGLESIVDRASAIDPANRYPTARQLQEDLQRHLDNRPLLHAPNRSIGERARKWARRHPRLSSAGMVGTLCLLVIAALVSSLWVRGKRIARDQAYDQWRQLKSELAEGRRSLNSPYVGLDALNASVRKAELALEQYGLPGPGWEARDVFQYVDKRELPSLRHDAAELLYLVASGKGQQAVVAVDSEQRKSLLQEALALNQASQATLGADSLAFSMQRARLLDADGQSAAAESARESLGQSKVIAPRDRRLLAFEASKSHDPIRAASLLEGLIKTSPQDPATWFSLGNCYMDLRRYAEAEGCFTTAIALHPEFTLGYDHRGLARLALERNREARDDFSLVVDRRPDLTSALVNRALALKALGKNQEAARDLSEALRKGASQTRIYFIRARLRAALNDMQGAEADRTEGLRRIPRDELSWIARGVAQLKASPEKALADFRKAVEINPRSRSGWQNIAHVFSEHLSQNDRAIDAMNRLVAIESGSAGALASRGVLHARLNDRDKAIADGEAALRVASEPFVIYQIGCIYSLVSMGSSDDAARAVELVARALQSDPSLVEVAKSDSDLLAVRNSAALQNVLRSAETLLRAARHRSSHQ